MATIWVAALSAAACLPTPTDWRGEPDGPRLAVVGDSLVHAAETGGGLEENDPDRFLSDLAGERGFNTSVSAMIGAETEDLAVVARFPEPGPEVMVIALGTNDMRDRAIPVEEAISNIVAYLDGMDVACAALVTIIDEPSWGLDVTAPPYNAALAALADEREDVILADWAPVADAHPEYLLRDGVHHSEAGKQAYRELLVDAAESCVELIDAQDPSTSTTVPDQSTTTVPDQSTTTVPDQSTTTVPDQSTTTVPDQSTTTVPDQSTTTVPDQSTTTVPDQSTTTAPAS